MSETNYAVAPGEYIEEWLEDNNRDASWLAKRINASVEFMLCLIAGEEELDVATAFSIANATGIEGRIWMNHERQYRADLARLAAIEVNR
ncbi:hypothetical protein [Rhodococcoides fascians]|uniref:hypothetical protein n=1 Tax=Rhodococcoides fascians TaxID=1828 RepID=UPI00050C8E92|nr:hypothetical protein [Rhodococcus fascians]